MNCSNIKISEMPQIKELVGSELFPLVYKGQNQTISTDDLVQNISNAIFNHCPHPHHSGNCGDIDYKVNKALELGKEALATAQYTSCQLSQEATLREDGDDNLKTLLSSTILGLNYKDIEEDKVIIKIQENAGIISPTKSYISQIKLGQYTIGTAGNIVSTDTLQQALGKLEAKLNSLSVEAVQYTLVPNPTFLLRSPDSSGVYSNNTDAISFTVKKLYKGKEEDITANVGNNSGNPVIGGKKCVNNVISTFLLTTDASPSIPGTDSYIKYHVKDLTHKGDYVVFTLYDGYTYNEETDVYTPGPILTSYSINLMFDSGDQVSTLTLVDTAESGTGAFKVNASDLTKATAAITIAQSAGDSTYTGQGGTFTANISGTIKTSKIALDTISASQIDYVINH